MRNWSKPLLLLFISLLLTHVHASDWVWWEGESAVQTNFPSRTSFSSSTFADKKDLLSGGQWLCIEGKRTGEEGYAKYKVSVPADGDYELWTRKFWKHGPFKWRFDDAAGWQTCGRDCALADSTPIRQHLCANWVFLGNVKLSKGAHAFELRLLAGPGEDLVACFDAFVLSSKSFLPRGPLKPGEKYGRADPGYFPFEPSLDPFTPDALLDLRSLNEKTAGEKGFIGRKGRQFITSDGAPVRFWAVNAGYGNAGASRASVDFLARKLAKLGVNLVRVHGAVFDRSDIRRIDAKKLDDLHYLVSTMKRAGIYTEVSFYFPLWVEMRDEYGLPGYDPLKNKHPFSVLYWEPEFQKLHLSWLRALMTTPNPYAGGMPLGQEPAVAMVELVNEDSLFFWTFSKNNIPALSWERLERLYTAWLASRYPAGLSAAYSAWGSARVPGDTADKATLLEAWHMTGEGVKTGGEDKRRRMSDQVRFLADTQRTFYLQTARTYHDELNARPLLVDSNWTVCDPSLLDALERDTYTAGDVMDRHGYFQGRHEGQASAWAVEPGQTFEDLAGVLVPEQLPLQAFQTDGYPSIQSEVGWPNPNRYRGEAPLLVSAAGSVQDLGGVVLFSMGSNFCLDSSMEKFGLGSPAMAWSFPAAALMYRRGDMKVSAPAVFQTLDREALFSMKSGGGAGAQALDDTRRSDLPAGAVGAGASVDPLDFLIGPVVRGFGSGPSRSKGADLTGLKDRAGRKFKSLTHELSWDYGRGVVTVDTPRTQAAAGFLTRTGVIRLTDVAIESRNAFGSVWVTSLDGLPLKESKKILIQASTEDRTFGFTAENGKIVSTGSAPYEMRKVDMTVTLPGKGKLKVVALDENGYATGKKVKVSGGTITLSPDTLYHMVTR